MSQSYDAQQGQALALGLVMMGVIALSMLAFFQHSMMFQGKTRLQLASDSAAYSAALVQARTLNQFAYTHRTQLAHQVAMAHLVTLASWASFGDAEAKRLATSNPPLWTIAAFFGSHGQAYAQSAKVTGAKQHYVAGRLADAFSFHDKTVHDVLWRAQWDGYTNLTRSRQTTMDQVFAKFFSSNHQPMIRLLEDTWDSQLKPTDTQSTWIPFLRDIQQHYAFLQGRNYQTQSVAPVSERCPHLRHELRRQGETQLNDQGAWASVDTQSWHALRSNRFIGCYFREYPMGYGVVQIGAHGLDDDSISHQSDAPFDFSQQDFWRWAQTHTTWNIFSGSQNPLANSWAIADKTSWVSRGLPRIIVLSASTRPSLTLTLEAIHQQAFNQANSQAVLQAVSSFGVDTQAADRAMRVTSRAEAFYEHPQHKSGASPNLYFAYWQARLIPESEF